RRESPISRPQCPAVDVAAVAAAVDAVDIRARLVNRVKARRCRRAAVVVDAVVPAVGGRARIRRQPELALVQLVRILTRAAELQQHNHQQDAVLIPLRLEVVARMLLEDAALIRTPAAGRFPAMAVVASVDRPAWAT